jgi:hypothetical protein
MPELVFDWAKGALAFMGATWELVCRFEDVLDEDERLGIVDALNC